MSVKHKNLVVELFGSLAVYIYIPISESQLSQMENNFANTIHKTGDFQTSHVTSWSEVHTCFGQRMEILC